VIGHRGEQVEEEQVMVVYGQEDWTGRRMRRASFWACFDGEKQNVARWELCARFSLCDASLRIRPSTLSHTLSY
jgi:hypothetical protein